MKTIKEVLENQEAVSREISKLLMDGKSDEALEIISELGYQIRTENQAPLDNKAEFDNEAHELAVFLQGVLADVERKADISQVSIARVINEAKKAVRDITNDVMKTAEIRQSLSEYDVELYRKNLEKGVKEAEDELAKTQTEFEQMQTIRTEIYGDPRITEDDSLAEEQKYTQIRDNLAKAVKKYSAFLPFTSLRNVDFSKMDPSTEEGRKQIDAACKPFLQVFSDLDRRRLNAENNIETFKMELDTLSREKEALSRDVTDKDAYIAGMDDATKAIAESRKEAAHQDNVDKFYGNEALGVNNATDVHGNVTYGGDGGVAGKGRNNYS